MDGSYPEIVLCSRPAPSTRTQPFRICCYENNAKKHRKRGPAISPHLPHLASIQRYNLGTVAREGHKSMKYRTLGRTGFEVSEIAHGLWGMGDWSDSEDERSLEALQLAVDLGCNFFDTA